MFLCVCICVVHTYLHKLTDTLWKEERNKGHFSWPWGQELRSYKNKHLWDEFKGSCMRQLFSSAFYLVEEKLLACLQYSQMSINSFHNWFVQQIAQSYWLSVLLLWIYTVPSIMHHWCPTIAVSEHQRS